MSSYFCISHDGTQYIIILIASLHMTAVQYQAGQQGEAILVHNSSADAQHLPVESPHAFPLSPRLFTSALLSHSPISPSRQPWRE